MEFNDFCNEIRDNIGEYLLGYDFDNIQLQEVTHNNNTPHTGLVISREDVNIAPTIYMEQYYRQYQDTGDLDAVIKEIADVYKGSLESTNDMPVEIFNQKEQYFSNCYLKVVNYEKNKDMLQDVPYKKYMDLAVTIRMLVRVDETGMASAIVTHDHTARLGINEKDLYAAALKNTEFLFPVRINKLEDVTRSLDSNGLVQEELPDTGIYVLSNLPRIAGATTILYAQDQVTQLAGELECGFYIVPSSTNEVLLCPDNDEMDPEMLHRTAMEVNKFVVSDTEFLSNSIYHIDKDSREIKMELPDPQIDDRQNQRGI